MKAERTLAKIKDANTNNDLKNFQREYFISLTDWLLALANVRWNEIQEIQEIWANAHEMRDSIGNIFSSLVKYTPQADIAKNSQKTCYCEL